MSALNVLFSALFAGGLFAVVVALGLRRPVVLGSLERLGGEGRIRRGPLARLQHALDIARLDVTAGEFMRVSLLLGLLGGAGAFLLSNAPLAGALGFLAGGLAYWTYLSSKAESALEAYENALPQVMARLVAGARLGETFVAAAEHVAQFGPEICRDDWRYIAEQVRAAGVKDRIFDAVARKRGSLLLNTIFELLIIQAQRGIPLTKTLVSIEESLRERVRMVRKARAAIQGPIRELWVVCAVPFATVALLRLVAPGYAAVYGTLLGQLFLFAGWGLTLLGFFLGYRSFARGLREETSFGALEPVERGRLEPARSPAGPALPGAAPVALRGVMAGEEGA